MWKNGRIILSYFGVFPKEQPYSQFAFCIYLLFILIYVIILLEFVCMKRGDFTNEKEK